MWLAAWLNYQLGSAGLYGCRVIDWHSSKTYPRCGVYFGGSFKCGTLRSPLKIGTIYQWFYYRPTKLNILFLCLILHKSNPATFNDERGKGGPMVNICNPQWLGQIPYGAALSLQKELVARRAANEIPDTLLMLEHPPTYTIGIDGHREHLLINQEDFVQLNVAYHRVDRGGSVTFHGPGQLVCYPIIDLKKCRLDYHRYLRTLESVIIHTLAAFKVRAFRERGQVGVSVFTDNIPSDSARWFQSDRNTAQIAAIGVKINHDHITSHGFSININPDLSFFDLIVPCGLHDCRVTSLTRVLNRPVEISCVVEPVIQSFCQVFEMEQMELASMEPALAALGAY